MRSFAQREPRPEIPKARIGRSDTTRVAARQDPLSILHLQRTIGNQAVFRQLELANRGFIVRGKIPAPNDTIHGPLLDEYSRETGLPRDQVSQHDPGYEKWVTGSVNLNIDMEVPAKNPAPNYSQTENQLGAWEKANLIFAFHGFAICDHTVSNGVESSFVTDVTFEFAQPTFQYFIAQHIHDNMEDRTKDTSERVVWRQIHNRIETHALEHFVRYRQVVDTMRQVVVQRLSALPARKSPIRIPQQDLETWVNSLLLYLLAKVRHELWRTTCNWEKTDYPTLLKGIPNVQGKFQVACDPEPVVPPEPMMPVVVTPGPSQTNPPAPHNKP